MTAKGGVESEDSDSPAKIRGIGDKSWKAASVCSLVRELVPLSTAQQEPEATPGRQSVPVHSANPTWKESVQEDSLSSSKPEGSDSGRGNRFEVTQIASRIWAHK